MKKNICDIENGGRQTVDGRRLLKGLQPQEQSQIENSKSEILNPFHLRVALKHYAILIFFLSPFFLLAQSPHPYFRNFTTEEGLPSPEVHDILEDDDGYIWFATDNGISKFDGYDFKNYGPEQGLKHHVATYLQKDSSGTIWVATLNGHLYYLENLPSGKDTILPFSENDIIDSLNSNHIIDFLIDSIDNKKYIATQGEGIFVFTSDKDFTQVKSNNKPGAIIGLQTDSRWISGGTHIKLKAPRFDNKWINQLEIISDKRRLIKNSQEQNFRHYNFWLRTFNDSIHLFHYNEFFSNFQKDSLVKKGRVDGRFSLKSILENDDGRILVGIQKGKGLRSYEGLNELLSNKYSLLIPNISVSAIFKDSKNGWWISTLENGIFYCPNIVQKIFDIRSGLSGDYISAISFKNEEELFIGLRNGAVYLLNLKTNHLEKLPPIQEFFNMRSMFSNIIYDLVYSKKQKELWVSTGAHAYLSEGSKKWKAVVGNNFSNNPHFIIGKKLSLNPSETILWGGNSIGFGGVNILKKETHFLGIGAEFLVRIFVVKEDLAGNVWVGNARGLFELKNDQLVRPEPFFEAFDFRVEDIEQLADSTLVIATKGAGVLLWKSNFFKQIRQKDGLTSNMIENLHVDSSGTIWVGTLEGLNKLMPTDSSYQIRNYFTWHGLPSNEITQVRSFGKQVWVATTKGLIQWNEPQQAGKISRPILDKISVNNQSYNLKDSKKFSHNENNFEFQFLTLNYRVPRKIPYRFRLNGGEWTNTQNRSVNYANLAPGDYLFEVQSQTEDRMWSASTDYKFSILRPWFATWWFRSIFGLTVGGLIFFWYKNRTTQLKKEAALQQEINSLERAALNAQMNPHFIFNCLNSIQNFIVKNDRDQAVNYLSKFAKLTRRVLKSSADGKIILAEEIEFLKNYLSLEKLRFKNKFEFSFEIDKNLNLLDSYLPPLLIQPFVENAIKHGMKNKTTNGKIELFFEDANESVQVRIRDNGDGIFSTQNKSKLHRSMGMSITGRRLEIMDAELPVEINELKGESGNVLGTEVRFSIKKMT